MAEAERMFKRALEIDPDSPDAHYGLSVALPRQSFVEQGIDHALLAVGLRHEFPEAHFQLGALISRWAGSSAPCRLSRYLCDCVPVFSSRTAILGMVYGRKAGPISRLNPGEVARLRKLRVPQPVAD